MFKHLILFICFVGSAQAADLCETYVEFCPGYVRNVLPGGSYPSFSDAFNVNPAAIPTTETPIGIEAIRTTKGTNTDAATNFSLIKGFNRAGVGLSSNSDTTLYGYNLLQGFDGTGYKDQISSFKGTNTVMNSLNLGSALAVLPAKLIPVFNSPTLGANLRYNQLTKKWDFQYGASINSSFITAGVSYHKSDGVSKTVTSSDGVSASADTYIPPISTLSLTAAVKLAILDAEYTELRLRSSDAALNAYSIFSKPVKIITLSLHLDALQFSYARREAYNVDDNKIIRTLMAAQLKLTSNFALGFQRNYVPGASSASAQLLF